MASEKCSKCGGPVFQATFNAKADGTTTLKKFCTICGWKQISTVKWRRREQEATNG